jgi:hypothetical protein
VVVVEEDLLILKNNDTIEGPRAHGRGVQGLRVRGTDACENVSIISRK